MQNSPLRTSEIWTWPLPRDLVPGHKSTRSLAAVLFTGCVLFVILASLALFWLITLPA